MSGDLQLELWLHEYKMKTLDDVLAKEGTTVEQKMQDMLTELYVARVPKDVRQEISARIKEELASQEAELEASRQYTAFHVRENGQEEYYRLAEQRELLYAAYDLRRYLQQANGEGAGSFSELYPGRVLITPEEFERMVGVRMENTGKVTGAFEIDFEKREFSAVHIMDGWRTWPMDAVSAAAWHAFHKAQLCEDARYEILLNKLEGREITPQPEPMITEDMSPPMQPTI